MIDSFDSQSGGPENKAGHFPLVPKHQQDRGVEKGHGYQFVVHAAKNYVMHHVRRPDQKKQSTRRGLRNYEFPLV